VVRFGIFFLFFFGYSSHHILQISVELCLVSLLPLTLDQTIPPPAALSRFLLAFVFVSSSLPLK
jgi:hypothetical protein